MTRDRLIAEKRGRRGETIAAWYLRFKGWHIVGQRLKTPRGEVDLVARRGAVVAFIEVKWRAAASDLDTAIDVRRLRRVAAAAGALTPRFTKPGDDVRIDVLLVTPGKFPRHLVNVWQP